MMKRLIVGLNNSELSKSAAETAITWARLYGLQVTFVSVVDLTTLGKGEPVPVGGGAFKAHRDQVLIAEASATADQLLADYIGQARSHGVVAEGRKREGDPAVILLEEAQRGDLLLIGCKEAGRAEALSLEGLLRRTTRPVVLAPRGGIRPVDTVLVAYDGSPEAAKTLQAFQMLHPTQHSKLKLLGVGEDNSAVLELAADYLRLHGATVDVVLQNKGGSPGDVILQEAERCNAGVIVMGACGRGRIAETILGSATRRVISRSSIPLFLFH